MDNPASPYLLDRLQARRANHSNTRSRRSDSGPPLPQPTDFEDDDLFLNEAKSSGHASASRATTPNRSNSINNKTNNPMTPASSSSLGAREMEKRMDKLSKLNFDLKLELFHCRERMAKLQENCKTLATKAERANRLVEENATLLELNDSLVKELEHRDEAVQEAVTIICDLEERLEHVQLHQQQQQLLDLPSAATTAIISPSPNSTISTHKNSGTSPSASSQHKRIPSFVVDKKPSTRALRSVYQDPTPTLHAVKSYASLKSHIHGEIIDENASDVDADALDSPRLSVLSESSFPSIYNKDIGAAAEGVEEGRFKAIARNAGTKRDYSDSDVNSWIQVHTPRSVGNSLRPEHQNNPQFTAHAAESTHQTRNKPTSPATSNYGGGGALLPPTPDSASTSLLQDSYLTHYPHSRAPQSQKTPANLVNAERHAALLHTPEIMHPADMSKMHLLPQGATTNGPVSATAAAVWANRHSISLSSTDEEQEEAFYEQFSYNGNTSSNDNSRTGSAGSDQSYPNGASIHKGTPSRFQVRGSPAVVAAKNARFEDAAVQELAQFGKKRMAGGVTDVSPRRYRMERSETTPNLVVVEKSPLATLPDTTTTTAFKAFVQEQRQHRPQRMERSETTPNLQQQTHLFQPLGVSDHQRQDEKQKHQRRRSRSIFTPGPLISKPASTTTGGGGGSGGGGHAGKGVRAALSEKTHKFFRRMSEHGSHHTHTLDGNNPNSEMNNGNHNNFGEEKLADRGLSFSNGTAIMTESRSLNSRGSGSGGGGGGLFRRATGGTMAAGSLRR